MNLKRQKGFGNDTFHSAPCMPDIYKISEDAVECYREFYIVGKQEKMEVKYKNREIPFFLKNK